MYRDIELSIEEEDELIDMIAQKIHENGLDMYAVFMIETIKPLSFIGANMGRAMFAPFVPALSNTAGITTKKFFQVLEKRGNADKLIKAIDKLTKEEKERKKLEKAKKTDGEEPNKKWWQRLISR